MTPERFRECLDAIGWTGRELARRLEVDERQVRRWSSGSEMPQRVADWIEALAEAHQANPPPGRPE